MKNLLSNLSETILRWRLMFYINFRHRFFPLWRFLSSAGDLKVGVSGIVEFRLLEWKVPPNSAGTSFNAHPENAFMLLKTFYAALLRYDPYWHFLHEGSFTLLRVSSCFKKMIQMYLVAAKVEYTVGVWGEDNQEATKKYQRIYTYIFHGTSILAMECDSYNDAWKASDRVIHCSNLQQIYHLYDTHKHLYTMWEMGFLLDLAVARGRFVAGMWQLELPETTVIDWAKHTIDYQFAKKEEEVHEKAQIN